MFSRKSKVKQRARAADKADSGGREQVDELAEALDDARDAIARASAVTLATSDCSSLERATSSTRSASAKPGMRCSDPPVST